MDPDGLVVYGTADCQRRAVWTDGQTKERPARAGRRTGAEAAPLQIVPFPAAQLLVAGHDSFMTGANDVVIEHGPGTKRYGRTGLFAASLHCWRKLSLSLSLKVPPDLVNNSSSPMQPPLMN